MPWSWNRTTSTTPVRRATSFREDGARLDVVTDGFGGGSRQKTSVFNLFGRSYCQSTLAQCYRKKEQEKRAYDESVREVKHGFFSPLVFSTSTNMGPIATVVYRHLTSMIAERWDEPYSHTFWRLRCRLSFSLLRLAIARLRRACSSQGQPAPYNVIDLTCSEGRVPTICFLFPVFF